MWLSCGVVRYGVSSDPTKDCSHCQSSRKTDVTVVCWSSYQRTGHKDGKIGTETAFVINSYYIIILIPAQVILVSA